MFAPKPMVLWLLLGTIPCYGNDLCQAIVEHRLAPVEAYLAAGGDPNVTIECAAPTRDHELQKLPLLGWAFVTGDDAAAVVLLRAGADAHLVERSRLYPGHSLLTIAASNGLRETARHIMQANPSTLVDKEGGSPLEAASQAGHRAIVADMLEAGCKNAIDWGEVLDGALLEAAINGHVDVMLVLLAAGANVNNPSVWSAAIGYQDPMVVGTLLAAGLDVSNRDAGGWRALDIAVFAMDRGGQSAGSKAIVKLIASATPDVCAPLAPPLLSREDSGDGRPRITEVAATQKSLYEVLPECNWAELLPAADGSESTVPR